jgi:CBS domain containing-hemolysin-like protein
MYNLTLIYIAIFIILILFSFFLNYLSALYSEVDLFKVDLTQKQKEKRKKIKKLIFVLKNGQLLFAVICFIQVVINMFISIIISDNISQEFLEKAWISRGAIIFWLSIFVALITEIFSRYLASRPASKNLILKDFFVDLTYTLVRPLSFLKKVVRPKKKIFVNSEQDIIRFVNNLTVENILEKKEAKLIQSAFNFDEAKVSSVFIPLKKTIFLNKDMSYEEFKKVHSKYFFTRYPVRNEKKEILGTFNTKTFYWILIKSENIFWHDYIEKKKVFISPQDKLNKAFEKMQSANCQLAIVRENKKVLGIVTLQDILNALVGKMRDEKEKVTQKLRH